MCLWHIQLLANIQGQCVRYSSALCLLCLQDAFYCQVVSLSLFFLCCITSQPQPAQPQSVFQPSLSCQLSASLMPPQSCNWFDSQLCSAPQVEVKLDPSLKGTSHVVVQCGCWPCWSNCHRKPLPENPTCGLQQLMSYSYSSLQPSCAT